MVCLCFVLGIFVCELFGVNAWYTIGYVVICVLSTSRESEK